MKAYIIVSLLVLAIFLTACGPQELYLCDDGSIAGNQRATKNNVVYVCPDGITTKDISRCIFTKQTTLTKTQAEQNALGFVQGYVMDNAWTARLINVYLEESNWYAQIVISKYDEQAYETLVKVNGQRGTVTCFENCKYIPQTSSEDLS